MKPLWMVLGCAAAVGLQGAEDSLPRVKTAPKRVAVFKNGLGFVVRSGEARLSAGAAELDSLPAASLGALWISTDDPNKRVLEVSSFASKESSEVDPVNLGELLEANLGSSAAITYSQGGGSANIAIIQGEIIRVPKDRVASEADGSNPAGIYSSRVFRPDPSQAPARGEIVIVRTPNDEIVAINKNSIQSVRFARNAFKTALERDTMRTRVRFEPQIEQANISMLYLQKGWNWSPSYLVDIANGKEAQVTLEAVLANDVEDLENAQISFVVGYPNFAFADVMNPLSSGQTVAQFVQALLAHNEPRRGRLDFGIMAQNAVAYSGREVLGSDSYSPDAVADGQSSEDLFLYNRPNVTLPKGGRARFVLLSGRVPYEHIYQWDLKDVSPLRYYSAEPDPNRAAEKESEVWHTLRLANTTKQPWTTAPALTVNGQLPVAQDTLKYTPPGATNSLKITVASDIRANQELTELSREPVSSLNSRYAKVEVLSKLTVQNLKREAVKIVINRSVSGEVSAPGGAIVRKAARELNALNLSTELVWEFPLAPGEKKEIEFKYSTLAPR
jgi:hypothetical protein